METCGNLNSSKAFLGFPRFSKYPVTNHITWIHGNPRDSSWIHVGYMEMYGNPHVSKLSMWNYVDRTAKKFRDVHILNSSQLIYLFYISCQSWTPKYAHMQDSTLLASEVS